MPVTLKKVGGVYRIVVAKSAVIARTKLGNPVDGGRAHCKSRPISVAKRQVIHINEGR